MAFGRAHLFPIRGTVFAEKEGGEFLHQEREGRRVAPIVASELLARQDRRLVTRRAGDGGVGDGVALERMRIDERGKIRGGYL